MNFKKPSFSDQIPDWLKIDFEPKNNKNKKETKKKANLNLKFDLKGELDKTERWLLRVISGMLTFIIIYSVITMVLKSETDKKIEQAENIIQQTSAEIAKVDNDIQKINNKSSSYQKMTENLKKYSDKAEEKLKTKNVIPMLLTRIMNVIPKGVTITSIENKSNSHIIINAQSADYDLLGFFKGSLIVEGVLDPSTVVSTSGIKQNGIVKIVIEGDLP